MAFENLIIRARSVTKSYEETVCQILIWMYGMDQLLCWECQVQEKLLPEINCGFEKPDSGLIEMK